MKKLCFVIWVLMGVPCLAQDTVVLRKGELRADKLWGGAFADVTYRNDKDKQTTANGQIKDVRQNVFTLGKGLWREDIAFERVDVIVLGEKKHLVEETKKRLQGAFQQDRVQSNKSIVMEQVLMGSGLGVVGGFAGVLVGVGIERGRNRSGDFFIPAGPILGGAIGMVVGSAAGVTFASKGKLQGSLWRRALGGSFVGFGLAIQAISMSTSLWPALLIAPPVVATSFCWLGNRRVEKYGTLNMGLMQNGRQGIWASFHF